MTNVAHRRLVLDVVARALAIVIAILLVGVPVVLLLMTYGVLPATDVNSATGYRYSLDSLNALQTSEATSGVIWFGIISTIVAAIALTFLLLMLFLRPRSRDAVIESAPGRETVLRQRAVRHLAEGAARSAGARDPDVDVSFRRGGYDISCVFRVMGFKDVAERAEHVRDRIESELTDAGVNVRRVEATVHGIALSRHERTRVP